MNPKSDLRVFLGALGVHESAANEFFLHLKAAHFGQPVDIASFVGGCVKLCGGAQSIDLQGMMCELKLLHRKVRDIHHEVKSVSSEIAERLASSPERAYHRLDV